MDNFDEFDSNSSSPPPPPPPQADADGEEYISLENFQDGLPYPLERHYSEEDQRYYIFNSETNECFWEDELFDDEENPEDQFFEQQLEQYENEIEEYHDRYANKDQEQKEHEEQQQQHYPADDSQDKLLQKYMDNTDLLNELENDTDPAINDDMISLADLAQFELDDYSYQTDNSQALSVVERSNLMLQNKSQKIAQYRHERDMQELQELKLQPKLTKKSQQIQRSVDDMLSWEEQRKQKLNQKTREKEEKERAQQTGRPMVTKKAQAMARRWQQQSQQDDYGEELSLLSGSPSRDGSSTKYNNADSPGDGNRSTAGYSMVSMGTKSVQDRLYDYEAKRKQKLALLKSQQDREARAQAKPKINANTDRLLQSRKFVIYGPNGYPHDDEESSARSNASVADRLYALAQLQHRSDTDSTGYDAGGGMLAHGRLLQHDPTTGQRLFEPKINRMSKHLASQRRRPASHLSIEDQLQLQGQLYQQKLLTRQQRKELAFQEHLRQSKINPKSAQMIQEKELLTGETTKDRLMKPIKQTIKQKTLETIPKLTFQPKINETSQAILSQSGKSYYARYTYIPPADLANEGGSEQQQGQMGYGAGPDEYYPIGEAVCVDDLQSVHSNIATTLLPPDHAYYSNHSNHHGSGQGGGGEERKNSAHASSQDSTIYNRTLYWQEQREKRLHYERLAKEKEEQEQCTFRPKVAASNVDISNRKSIADRHAEWVKRREDKLAMERQKLEEEELRDCTFVPKVPLPVKSTLPPPTPAPVPAPSSSSSGGVANSDASVTSGSGGYSQRYVSSSAPNTPERARKTLATGGAPPPLPATTSVKGILRAPAPKPQQNALPGASTDSSVSLYSTSQDGEGEYLSSAASAVSTTSQGTAGGGNYGSRRVRIQLTQSQITHPGEYVQGDQVRLGAEEEEQEEEEEAEEGEDESFPYSSPPYYPPQQQPQLPSQLQHSQPQYQTQYQGQYQAQHQPQQQVEEEPQPEGAQEEQLTYEQLEELHRYQLKYQQQQMLQQQQHQQQYQQQEYQPPPWQQQQQLRSSSSTGYQTHPTNYTNQSNQLYYDNEAEETEEWYGQQDNQSSYSQPSHQSRYQSMPAMRSQPQASQPYLQRHLQPQQGQGQVQVAREESQEYLYQDEAGNLVPVPRFQPQAQSQPQPPQQYQQPYQQKPYQPPHQQQSYQQPYQAAYPTNNPSYATADVGISYHPQKIPLPTTSNRIPIPTPAAPVSVPAPPTTNHLSYGHGDDRWTLQDPDDYQFNSPQRPPQPPPAPARTLVHPGSRPQPLPPSHPSVHTVHTVATRPPVQSGPRYYAASFDSFDDNMSQAYELE